MFTSEQLPELRRKIRAQAAIEARVLDELVKQDGQWYFAERRLMVNWTDTRPTTP